MTSQHSMMTSSANVPVELVPVDPYINIDETELQNRLTGSAELGHCPHCVQSVRISTQRKAALVYFRDSNGKSIDLPCLISLVTLVSSCIVMIVVESDTQVCDFSGTKYVSFHRIVMRK